jgi:hypothetical protein
MPVYNRANRPTAIAHGGKEVEEIARLTTRVRG